MILNHSLGSVRRPGRPGRRARRTMAAAAIAFVALLIGGIAAGLLGSPGHRQPITRPSARPSTNASGQRAGPAPVPPATVAPADTPVQQQYDQALESGLSASPTVLAAETTAIPPPAVSPAWPAPQPSNDAQQWIQTFVTELLSINFSNQTRPGLASWLSYVEAPELLPGVPQAAQNKVLNLSLMNPSAAGSGSSPIPDESQWSALAAQHSAWSAHDLLIQPDSQWAQILAAGWQPVDQRFGAYDVSGLLTRAGGGQSTTAHFSLVIYVGSAHWQEGYGTVLVSKWGES